MSSICTNSSLSSGSSSSSIHHEPSKPMSNIRGLKSYYGEDLRRFLLDNGVVPSLSQLKSQLIAAYQLRVTPSQVLIKYIDGEDERVTVASDSNLREVVKMTESQGKSTLCLYLVVDAGATSMPSSSSSTQSLPSALTAASTAHPNCDRCGKSEQFTIWTVAPWASIKTGDINKPGEYLASTCRACGSPHRIINKIMTQGRADMILRAQTDSGKSLAEVLPQFCTKNNQPKGCYTCGKMKSPLVCLHIWCKPDKDWLIYEPDTEWLCSDTTIGLCGDDHKRYLGMFEQWLATEGRFNEEKALKQWLDGKPYDEVTLEVEPTIKC